LHYCPKNGGEIRHENASLADGSARGDAVVEDEPDKGVYQSGQTWDASGRSGMHDDIRVLPRGSVAGVQPVVKRGKMVGFPGVGRQQRQSRGQGISSRAVQEEVAIAELVGSQKTDDCPWKADQNEEAEQAQEEVIDVVHKRLGVGAEDLKTRSWGGSCRVSRCRI